MSSVAKLEHNLSIIESACYRLKFLKMISLHIFQAQGVQSGSSLEGVIGSPGVKLTLLGHSGECDLFFVYVDGQDATFNVSNSIKGLTYFKEQDFAGSEFICRLSLQMNN